MENNFIDEIVLFAKKSSLALDASVLVEGSRSEIEEGLSIALQKNGIVLYSETGASPSEYLPCVIEDYLNLLGDKLWSIESVTSSDSWETADITIKTHDNDSYAFSVKNVNNCDWVPHDLSVKLYEFSKKKSNRILLTLFGDDPYLVLALEHESAKELESIIERYVNVEEE